MIRVNELRINNWVNDLKEVPRQINGIQYPYSHLVSLRNKVLSEQVQLNEIKPIPLTEEILLKFGFGNEVDEIDGKMYNIYFVTNTDYLIEYFHYDKSYVFTDDMGLKVSINSVHQLQNLYFALTGEELEINL